MESEEEIDDSGFEIVGLVDNGNAVLDCIPTTRPDILLLDVNMPGRSGLDVLRTLRSRGDTRPVVLLTASLRDSDLVEALQLGVNGFMLKDGAAALLVTCLNQVRNGQRWIELRIPGAQTGLALFTPPGEEHRIGTFHSISFACDDVVKTHAALVERGVEFVQPPVKESWGTSAVFRDPDGNSFVLGDGR